ncbi:hypothetical protein GCM10028820_06370 [Tessaracoccus terricola]
MGGLTAASALVLSVVAAGGSAADPGVQEPDGPRTIVTTDPELDDLNSLLRMLLYSNEIDIEGLVYSASQHHYSGNGDDVEPHRWPAPDDVFHIDTAVNAYEEVYPNLVKHDPNYPTPDELRDKIYWGNVENVGDMASDTEGSDFIKEVLLDDEPGQVFLQAWGGPNTISRALKSIEDEYKGTDDWDAIYDKVIDKAVITSWGQQDTTFRDYVKPNWPELENREVATSIWGYGARGSVLEAEAFMLAPEWTAANVSDVGPIGAEYRVWGDGKFMADGFDDEDYFGYADMTREELEEMGFFVWTAPQPKGAWISEGDSSNFALLIENGLRNWEDPTWGGWGGRQQQSGDDPVSWTNRGVQDIGPDGQPRNDWAAARWFSDFQNDFATRLQWSVTSEYADANHHPEITIEQGVDLDRRPGSVVTLDASVVDPDGDKTNVSWWQYEEADTYSGKVNLSATAGLSTTFVVPADAPIGSTIHIIAKVSDDAEPALMNYKRVVVTVAEQNDPPIVPEPTPTVTVTAEPSPQPTVTVTPPNGSDIYDTPGFHKSSGRDWMTVCEPYSTVVDRCWTYIWSTSVQQAGSKFVQTNGWNFNNLTYVGGSRAAWATNPLGHAGSWTGDDGRQWRTECDTANTGRSGCRTYATADVIQRVGDGYQWVNKEVFNNQVRFR